MTAIIAPHGGALVLRTAPPAEIAAEAPGLPAVPVSARAAADAALIAEGAYSPLRGFLGEADYASVVAQGRLADGTLWPLPIALPVDEGTAREAAAAGAARLEAPDGTIRGILRAISAFRRTPREEALGIFGTEDPAHPGARQALSDPPWALGGDILWAEPPSPWGLPSWPRETRAEIASRGWKRIVAFQTRNPVHRAHEYVLKTALETADGLLLHPLVGPTKDDDLPADVRLKSYRALLEGCFPPSRVILAVFPAPMRYAGPREALFHAIARQNYGATHIVIGRDHAGVGRFHGPYDAQRIFETLRPGDLRIAPVPFEATFFCRACGTPASEKTCPHGREHRLELSGTELRAMLKAGKAPPPEFTRPEVARVLVEALRVPAAAAGGGAA